MPTTTEDPATLDEVLAAERREIWKRRGRPDGSGTPENLVGLALSGGGIRSATFGLGLLQEMHERGALAHVDYLSTVSGGGFVGGWWSAWLSRPSGGPKPIFPPREGIEPERRHAGGASGADPIHHLRLFANYLTPRKGLMSADTWRAITVVTRNLILTWLVLLPVLLAAVVAGQLYFIFAVDPQENYLADFAVAATTLPVMTSADSISRESAVLEARMERTEAIVERSRTAARPLLVLFGWAALLTVVWLVHGVRGGPWTLLSTLVGVGMVVSIGLTIYRALVPRGNGASQLLTGGWLVLLVAGAVILVVLCRALPWAAFDPRPEGDITRAGMEDMLRHRVTRAHLAVNVTLLACAIVLLVAGFSHDLIWFLFDSDSPGPLPGWVKQSGGWGAVLVALGTMGYTAWAGAPAGGGVGGGSSPSRAGRLVLAVAPLLTVVFLALVAAAAGRWLIDALGGAPREAWMELELVRLAGIGLFLALAVYENYERERREGKLAPRPAPISAAISGGAAFAALYFLLPEPVLWQVLLWLVVAWATLLVGYLSPSGERRRRQTGHLLLGAAILGLVFAGWIVWRLVDPVVGGARAIPLVPGQASWYSALTGTSILLALALACGTFVLVDRIVDPTPRRRAIALTTLALGAISAIVVIPFLPVPPSTVRYASAAVLIAVLALAWVIGLGWMANPNLLSLHAFYRGRLVRGYLGASNGRRGEESVTESVEGDDLKLSALSNCDSGAPYHLINTTLNLVAGSDLGTAQRSADSFLLSRHFCGSPRTGYRRTAEYMGDSLTLGTAVAISGAAASPNMGSHTPSAALSMLMALLNVRLAFWAPTPDRQFWRDSRVRLWPYYVLREVMSQTNELAPFCCLSDGGHFDNTGVYSLVERGCRCIILSDCGADPVPSFLDLGNTIRRCRIDFGAEIDLKIDPFVREEGKGARTHFIVGSIRYSRAHADSLGWAADASLDGLVIWMKPALTLDDEPADLRQYALYNPDFPQQSTSDQWYDEAQFESYRRLGVHTAGEVFGHPLPHDVPASLRESFASLFDQPATLTGVPS